MAMTAEGRIGVVTYGPNYRNEVTLRFAAGEGSGPTKAGSLTQATPSPAEKAAFEAAEKQKALDGQLCDAAVKGAAFLGAAIAGALLGWPEGGVGSSAYLPLPLALGISTDVGLAAAAFGVAFGLPVVVALLRNWQFFGQAAPHED